MAGIINIRITEEVRNILRIIANRENMSMQKILEKAVKEYHEKKFFEEFSMGYEKLKNDTEWQEETRIWEGTLNDGLEEE